MKNMEQIGKELQLISNLNNVIIYDEETIALDTFEGYTAYYSTAYNRWDLRNFEMYDRWTNEAVAALARIAPAMAAIAQYANRHATEIEDAYRNYQTI